MKRSLIALATAGLLTVGLSACSGGDEDAANEPDVATEEGTDPAADADTGEEPEGTAGVGTEEADAGAQETAGPGDGPDPGAAEWCQTVVEVSEDATLGSSTLDPDGSIAFLERVREGAPEAVAGDLDTMIEALRIIDPENLESLDEVDTEGLQQATSNLSDYISTNCAPGT